MERLVRKRRLSDSEDESSSDEDDETGVTPEQGEQLRWMRGTDQKEEGIVNIKQHQAELQKKIKHLAGVNDEVRLMLDQLPENAGCDVLFDPVYGDNTPEPPIRCKTGKKKRVFCESVAQAHRLTELVHDEKNRGNHDHRFYLAFRALTTELDQLLDNDPRPPEIVVEQIMDKVKSAIE